MFKSTTAAACLLGFGLVFASWTVSAAPVAIAASGRPAAAAAAVQYRYERRRYRPRYDDRRRYRGRAYEDRGYGGAIPRGGNVLGSGAIYGPRGY